MGWPFIPKIIRYHWLLWKKKYGWGYGSWTDQSIINRFKTVNSEITEEESFDEAITSESKSCNKMEIDLQKVRKKNHIKKQSTLILKISTHLKGEPKYIQLNGGKSMKL